MADPQGRRYRNSTVAQIVSIPAAPELCPPHWRLTNNSNIGRKLKSLLGETFNKTRKATHTVVHYTPPHLVMRIKDSDDYLTARAANPRTGQISPSVGSKTPSDPGAALKAHAQQVIRNSPSPTKRLGGTRLANEGKKIKEGVTATWLAGGGAFRGIDSGDLVLPMMASKPTARKIFCTEPAQLRDDQFVVKMPSAQEPQPYSFPGSNNDEIQAFEHYKRKTKRTSTDGYDRRLLHDGRNPSGGHTEHEARATFDRQPPVNTQYHSSTGAEPGIAPLNVVKRRMMAAKPAPTIHPESLTPRQSPQVQQKASFDQVWSQVAPGAARNFSPESLSTIVSSSFEHDMKNDESEAAPRKLSSGATAQSGLAHLNQLPRVRLVHPSLASTPASPAKEIRSCSLGCTKDESNTCVDSRKSSVQSQISKFSLFSEDNSKAQLLREQPEATLELMEIIVLALTVLSRSLKNFVLAHTEALIKLFPQNLTTWEKFMIVRALFCLLVKLTAVSIVAVLTWKVTTIAIQVLKLIFWPLAIVMKAARWVSPGA